MKFIGLPGALFLAVSLLSQPILAQTASDEKAAKEAKAAFREGNALFSKGKYIEAAEAYLRADALQPNWKIQYNIGQSLALAKLPGRALQAFERYLSMGGDDIPLKRREEVTDEVLRLRALVGFIEVEAPAGAVIRLDEVEVGVAPLPGPIPVAASVEHHLDAYVDGTVIADKTVMVSGGQTYSVSLVPVPVEVPEPVVETKEPEPPPAPAPVKPDRTMKNLGWAGVILGGSMVIAGAITGALAASKAGELEANCPDNTCTGGQSDKDLAASVDHLALATDILLPVGGAIAVTGTVLLIVALKKERREENLSFVPRLEPGGVGMLIQGRF